VRALRGEGLAMSWDLHTTFRVHGSPKGQPRVRRSKSGGVFTPDSAKEWKTAIQLEANIKTRLHCLGLEGPIRVDERFFFPCPVRLEQEAAHRLIPHTSKPDRDNCDKVVLDALTQIGAFKDDAQVAAGVIEKWYARRGEDPGAEIHVYVWKED
jgi:Holliday junction resolvase RusA-like endonuclease